MTRTTTRTKPSRDTGLSLLRNAPSRALMLEKMRGKLATTPAPARIEAMRGRQMRRSAASAWTLRGLSLLGLVALNYFVLGHKDAIAAQLGRRAVESLPRPGQAYGTDEQALYYAYALYDYPRLKEAYGIEGFYAVDEKEARRRLDELLPSASPRTLGIIGRYAPVAFMQGPAGRGE